MAIETELIDVVTKETSVVLEHYETQWVVLITKFNRGERIVKLESHPFVYRGQLSRKQMIGMFPDSTHSMLTDDVKIYFTEQFLITRNGKLYFNKPIYNVNELIELNNVELKRI